LDDVKLRSRETGPGLDDVGLRSREAKPCLDEVGPRSRETKPCLDEVGLRSRETKPCLDEVGLRSREAKPRLDEVESRSREAKPRLGHEQRSLRTRKHPVPKLESRSACARAQPSNDGADHTAMGTRAHPRVRRTRWGTADWRSLASAILDGSRTGGGAAVSTASVSER
jgi:hypothetical protein